MNTISKNNSWERFLREVHGDSVENTGQIHIVRIDPAKYAARCPVESFVDGRSLSIIFLTVPVSKVLLVLSYYFDRVVGAATVQDEEFHMWVLLRDDRQDRLLNKMTLVERGSDHRYCR
jgi:hypothetical protein